MNKIDLLVASDIYSFNHDDLDIFRKMSVITDFTDYAYFSLNNPYLCKKGRWWLKSGDGEGNVDAVCEDGRCYQYEADSPCVGTRPIMKYSTVKNEIFNIVENEFGVLEGEYGEYIQKLISEAEQKKLELELAYLFDCCDLTGKAYHVIMPWNYTFNNYLDLKEFPELFYQGRKFVRVVKNKDIFWFEVSPIKWLISEEKDIMLSKNIVLGRIPICLEDEYYIEGNFENTDINHYLNDIFVNDIMPSQTDVMSKNLSKKKNDRFK